MISIKPITKESMKNSNTFARQSNSSNYNMRNSQISINVKPSKNLNDEFVYELFPSQVDETIITLQHGITNIEVDIGLTIHVHACNGKIMYQGKEFHHNDVIRMDKIWQRVVSICKRGQLNVIESTCIVDSLALTSSLPIEWANIETPLIVKSNPRNKLNLLKIRWNEDGLAMSGFMLEVKLLGTSSSFLWCPYPNETNRPNMIELAKTCMSARYHTVQPMPTDKERPLPVRMVCFERDYPFSNNILQKEPSTPASLLKLCNVVEKIFSHGKDRGPNMILMNYYPTGHHHIPQHKDNGPEMGTLRDVYAFVDGYAREMTFTKGKNDEVLCVKVPAGFYCMYGDRFQQDFYHEIKESYAKDFSALFKKLRVLPEFANVKEPNSNRVKIPLSEEIMKCPGDVRTIIENIENGKLDGSDSGDGHVQKSLDAYFMPQQKKARLELQHARKQARGQWFDEWIKPRISYTLRRFD
jgi:hypothetical protein